MNHYPIRSLSPVITDATLVGLVTNKTSIKSFESRGGKAGEVFSFTIQDGTDSIKCSCWNGMTIHSNCFCIGDVVQIENPDIKSKKLSTYSNDTTSDYDLHLADTNSNCNILLIVQRNENLNYLFRPLNPLVTQIQSFESLIDQTVNICASVGKICGTIPVKSKNGDTTRTKIHLFDRTGQVTLIMWGEEAEAIIPKVDEGKTVIYFGSVKISNYQGEMQVSTGFSSSIILSPKLPYAQELEQWLKNPSQNRKITEYFAKLPAPKMKVKSVDIDKQFKIGKLKEVLLDQSTECYGYFIATMCKFDLLNENSSYTGCKSCHKKVSACVCPTKRQQTTEFIVEADFIDETGKIVGLKLFTETVSSLINKTAEEFYSLDPREQEIIAFNTTWKRCKVCFKMTLGSNSTAKYTILDCKIYQAEE